MCWTAVSTNDRVLEYRPMRTFLVEVTTHLPTHPIFVSATFLWIRNTIFLANTFFMCLGVVARTTLYSLHREGNDTMIMYRT